MDLPFTAQLRMDAQVTSASTSSSTANIDAQILANASKYNDCEQLKNEIWNGRDVNSQDTVGWTALMEAALHDHSDVASLLILKGANIDLREKVNIFFFYRAITLCSAHLCHLQYTTTNPL
jgi:ankyrin repeat protein